MVKVNAFPIKSRIRQGYIPCCLGYYRDISIRNNKLIEAIHWEKRIKFQITVFYVDHSKESITKNKTHRFNK
jgi:hypothetical protein